MKTGTRAGSESHLNHACKLSITTVKASILNLYSGKINIYQHPPTLSLLWTCKLT